MTQQLLLPRGVGSPGDFPFYLPFCFLSVLICVSLEIYLETRKAHPAQWQQAGLRLAGSFSPSFTRQEWPVYPALEDWRS